MLVEIDPDLYNKFAVMEQGQLVIYATLNKESHGNLRSYLLFWWKLTDKLVVRGYKTNPYNWCIVNKIIQVRQCTLLWHVDGLKILHFSKEVLEEESYLINNELGQEAPLTIKWGGGVMTT